MTDLYGGMTEDDLKRYLSMMKLPDDVEQRVRGEGLMGLGFTMLANAQKGRELEAIGRGGQVGLGTYNAAKADEIRQRGQDLTQAAMLRKMGRQDDFVSGFRSPQNAPGGAAGGGAAPTPYGDSGDAPAAPKSPLDQLLDMGIPELAIKTALASDNPQAEIQKLVVEYSKPHFGQGVIPIVPSRGGFRVAMPQGLPQAIAQTEAARKGGDVIDVPAPTAAEPGATRKALYRDVFPQQSVPGPGPAPAPQGGLTQGTTSDGIPVMTGPDGRAAADPAFARSVGVEPQPLPERPPLTTAPGAVNRQQLEQKTQAEAAGKLNEDWITNSYRPALEADKSAKKMAPKLDMLARLPIDSKTGWTAPVVAGAAQFLSGLGMASDRAKELASSYELFQSAVLDYNWQLLSAQKGPQTEGDASRAKATWVQVQNQPEANAFLRDFTRANGNLASAQADFYRKALGQPQYRGNYAAIDKAWAEVQPSIWDDPAMAKWAKFGDKKAPEPQRAENPVRMSGGRITNAPGAVQESIDDIVRRNRRGS